LNFDKLERGSEVQTTPSCSSSSNGGEEGVKERVENKKGRRLIFEMNLRKAKDNIKFIHNNTLI